MRPQLKITDKDRREIFEMASRGMRYADIAIIKDISLATLKRRCKRELSRGKRIGIDGLLQTAYHMANDLKNPTMMCFLLKTQGGLREKSQVNMTVNEKKSKESTKRESMPNDPILAAKTYREIITRTD